MQPGTTWEAYSRSAAHEFKKYLTEPEVSLQCLKQHATGLYPEPDGCSPYHPIHYLCKTIFNIIFSPTFNSS
jgi:hypothetical protein